MRTSTLFASLLLPFTVPVLADPHDLHHARHHHDIARRASGDLQLHKRITDVRFTYYAVGLGACGKVNKPSDHIVALNADQFGPGFPGKHCFQQITITCRGKTTSATIMDRCPGCPFGGLDLSEGLFNFFGPSSLGVLTGDWEFGGGGGGGGGDDDKDEKPEPKHDPPKKPSPSHEPPPKTTTTHSSEKKKTTSTSTKSSSSSEKRTTSSHKSVTTTSSLNLKAGSATGLAVPTGTIKSTPGDPESINNINQVVIQLGGMVKA